MKFAFKKVMVTGGAGFIGSHLVDELLKSGCRVVVVDNLSTGRLQNLAHILDDIAFHEGDIQNFDFLSQCAQECEVIFHLAAVVSVQETIDNPLDSAQVNEIGTLNVFEAARKNNIKKVVFSSSCAVYGDDPQVPKKEHMQAAPCSPYGAQKLAGELYANVYNHLFDIHAVCLRYFNVFGPRQDPSSPYSGVISIFMDKAVSGTAPSIYGDGEQYRDFIFVKDVVQANFLAASSAFSGSAVFNIGTGRFILINQLWKLINELANQSIAPEYAPARPGDIIESLADIDKAGSVLGFSPAFTFEEGLRLTFDWYRNASLKKNL